MADEEDIIVTYRVVVDLGALDGYALNHFEVDGGSLFISNAEYGSAIGWNPGIQIIVEAERRGMLVPTKDPDIGA